MKISDLHNHTTFSDGRLSPGEVWAIANEKGYRVGISDHCGEGTFQINNDADFGNYLKELRKHPVLRAAELDLGTRLFISAQMLGECDYIIAGVHSIDGLDFFDRNAKLPPPEVLLDKMLDLIEAKARQYRFHVLAHPGLLPVGMRDEKERLLGEKWGLRLTELALKYGFALEISSRWELPSIDTVKLALDAGVDFSLGSDGHCRESVCRLEYSLRLAEKLKIPENRFWGC